MGIRKKHLFKEGNSVEDLKILESSLSAEKNKESPILVYRFCRIDPFANDPFLSY